MRTQAAIAARLRILLARTRRRVLAQRRLLQFKMMMLDGVRVTKVRLCLLQHSNTAPKLTAPVHPLSPPFVVQKERGGSKLTEKKLWLSPNFDVLKTSWSARGADASQNPAVPVCTIREVKVKQAGGGYSRKGASSGFAFSINAKATGVVEYEAPSTRVRELLVFGLRTLSKLPASDASDLVSGGTSRAGGGRAVAGAAPGSKAVQPAAALQRFGNAAIGDSRKAQATTGGFQGMRTASATSKAWTPASQAASAAARNRPAQGSVASMVSGAMGGGFGRDRGGSRATGHSPATPSDKKTMAGSDTSAPLPPAVADIPEDSETIPYEELKARAGMQNKELMLSQADFWEVFGITLPEFQALPGWKRTAQKKAKGLF